ncbi:hypothetical protein Misp06_00644 [Microbulbifer sp. NBRC 101763]|uniref:hypothetical protein n=1 Tax=Microbulbifer TaxID=48073 RepID=UPI00036BBE28|nr:MULTISPECIES: hypothetical protein [Microbulbifer]WHI49560.1 hypothetical protein P3339_13885 [Microbulbifer sp. MLAF003]
MSNQISLAGKPSQNSKLPQWISCQDCLPTAENATNRGLVRVIWKVATESEGATLIAWEVGMDHYENAHQYLGWMPIETIEEKVPSGSS